jgi:putative acetyltransferase
MRIRTATGLDRDEVREVHLCAFPEGEREMVSNLAVNLLAEETTPHTMSLVAETEGDIVGHVAFSPVTIANNEDLQGYLLAPLGVKPDYQKRRIGSELVESGMQQLSVMGVNILFVYGDPKYYCRFGFNADAADRYTPPYRIQYPIAWQAIALNACNTAKSSIRIACVTSLCDAELW